jgi:hypothetical protein
VKWVNGRKNSRGTKGIAEKIRVKGKNEINPWAGLSFANTCR